MFNANARWDRPLPQDDALPGQSIDVVVSFKRGGFFPLWFFLHGNKHIIKNVQFTWQEKKGIGVFDLFSVSDNNDTQYTICFIRKSFLWRIIEKDSD
ncbi:MAG: hypothetical protein KAS13_03650 [Candidatus Omnitrophica bacterium]|nr:hypothetical protein [Candidatus Omnitrophota bacterium]